MSFERFPETFSSASNQRPLSYCGPRHWHPAGAWVEEPMSEIATKGGLGLAACANQQGRHQSPGQHIRYRPATCLTISSASNSYGGAVTLVPFSPDGKRLTLASRDGTAKERDAATGDVVRMLERHGYSGQVGRLRHYRNMPAHRHRLY